MLTDIALDDLRFQELVSEARTRIVRHSPEWTEHNVSDPGITLIELFAWFTDILLYRINRIPERLHLAAPGTGRDHAGAAPPGARERSLRAGAARPWQRRSPPARRSPPRAPPGRTASCSEPRSR